MQLLVPEKLLSEPPKDINRSTRVRIHTHVTGLHDITPNRGVLFLSVFFFSWLGLHHRSNSDVEHLAR